MDEVVERLMDRADASGAALLGEGGLLTEVTRAVLERAPDAEMSEHLGYEKHDPAGRSSGNGRNGTSSKTVLTDAGAVTVTTPRDRNGSFEPKLGPKHARRLGGFNEQILSLYARGMSARDIRSHLAGMYGVEVSPDLISKVAITHGAPVRMCRRNSHGRAGPCLHLHSAPHTRLSAHALSLKLKVSLRFFGPKGVLFVLVFADGVAGCG
ncbi:transposase, partial [Streptomyces sp. NPDC046900]|uniref:transposase n=1 Tax=Streptomyces sp. NPDC046900 TaxID=3155473 RepID=UPI0033C9A551